MFRCLSFAPATTRWPNTWDSPVVQERVSADFLSPDLCYQHAYGFTNSCVQGHRVTNSCEVCRGSGTAVWYGRQIGCPPCHPSFLLDPFRYLLLCNWPSFFVSARGLLWHFAGPYLTRGNTFELCCHRRQRDWFLSLLLSSSTAWGTDWY